MKPTQFLLALILALALTLSVAPAPAQPANQVQISIVMTNVVWSPAAGTFSWLSPWELSASAAIFDSQNGFTNAYQTSSGQPASVFANASTPLMSAGGAAQVDATGNNLFLMSFLDETVTPGVTLTAFSAANAYREFEITGGIGSVAVNFGFDYSGLFQNTAGAGYGMDYTALLRISDGVNQWDLTSYEFFSGLGIHPFGGTLSQTFTLQYDTPYFISLIKDGETPEPGSLSLLSLGMVLLAGRQLLKVKRHGKQTALPGPTDS